MKERLKLILILLTFSGLSIVIILGSWLYGSYNQRVENLVSTTERALFNAVQEYIQNREPNVEHAFGNPFERPRILLKNDLFREISKATLGLSDDSVNAIADDISSRIFPDRFTSLPFPTPIPAGRRLIPNFFFSRYSFDSTSYEEIRKKFTEELRLGGVKASFNFEIISLQREPPFSAEGRHRPSPDNWGERAFNTISESGLNIRPLLIDAEQGRFIAVTLNRPRQFLLYSLSWQLIASVALVTTMVGCFVYLFYTIFQQNRLAMLRKEFVNNLTHELRTPVSTVYAAIQGLRNPTSQLDSEKKVLFLNIAKGELEHLSDMIDDVLNIAEGESVWEQPLAFENFDLVAVISNCISKVSLGKDGVSIEFDFDHIHDDGTMFGSPGHFANVVTNLLDNAIKYGSKTINITLTNDGSGNVELIVSDDGMGIPFAYQSQVFEPFFRVPTGDIHDVKGFGLGLSYVKQVVRQHGGKIKLKSKEGQGSTFILTIPKKQNND